MNIFKTCYFGFKRIKNSEKTWLAIILSQIYLILLALAIAFFTFKLLNYDVSTSDWLFNGEDSATEWLPKFYLSAGIILALCELLYFLSFYLYVPLIIVYPLVSALAIANYIKVSFRNEPLAFSDLFLLHEAGNISAGYELNLQRYVGHLLPIFIAFLIIAIFIKRIKFKLKSRLIISLSGVIISASFFWFTLVFENTVLETVYKSWIWNLTEEYKKNGFVLEFYSSIKRGLIFAPSDYNKNNVKDYAFEFGYSEENNNHNLNNIEDNQKPNVIVIMNESYWDTSHLTGVKFNQDPLESVREIMEKSGNISLLSPVIGGGTCNVEYEFLTGKNVIYYPPSSIVYQQFITKKQWSLAWYFRNYGYKTTAIHPYFNWFWKRDKVYPLLGFENMYFKDKKFEINSDGKYNSTEDNPLNYTNGKGAYIADKAVMDEIISRYNQHSNNGTIPVFTFAVTMQNHGEYYTRYWNDDRKIYAQNDIEENQKIILEMYSEGARFASEAFVYLTEYFKEVERPTYIVMFGDHAPTLATREEYYAINENGELYAQDYVNMYKTPVLIWTNLSGESEQLFYDNLQNVNTLTAQMLNDELFNLANMPKPEHIKILEYIRQNTNGYTSNYTLDNFGNIIGTNPAMVENYFVDYLSSNSQDYANANKVVDIYNKMRVIQYDETFGKNYVVDDFKLD